MGATRQVPAGCFPLALAKVLVYFGKPYPLPLRGKYIYLSELHNGYVGTREKQEIVANLMIGISQKCNSLYFYQGTFTFPWNVTSYMNSIGYNHAGSHDYKFSRVKAMIDKGCPLIMYGMPNLNITKSHAWNIDGYKIKVRTITKARYEGETRTKTFTVNDTCMMVHCDYGWGGMANGFYVSGVFDTRDENVEIDDSDIEIKHHKYNKLLKIITFDHP